MENLACCFAHRGTLYIKVGPMYARKTTWLNTELTTFADQGFRVLKIVHAEDKRDDVAWNGDDGSTHNSSFRGLTDKITIVRSKSLALVNVDDFDVVGVDEGQFFEDLFDNVSKWVTAGKHVRVVSLDGDSFMNPFGQVALLLPKADHFEKMTASCRLCLEQLRTVDFKGNLLNIEAPFTKRTVASKQQKLVGGSNMFIPVCRYHHEEN